MKKLNIYRGAARFAISALSALAFLALVTPVQAKTVTQVKNEQRAKDYKAKKAAEKAAK